MIWAQLLAYVTGTVDQELLLRNESGSGEPQNLFPSFAKGRPGGRIPLVPAHSKGRATELLKLDSTKWPARRPSVGQEIRHGCVTVPRDFVRSSPGAL